MSTATATALTPELAAKVERLDALLARIGARHEKVKFASSLAAEDMLLTHAILSKGIAHSPEGRKLFARMTVEENLRLGAYTRDDEAGIREDIDHVYTLFPVLGERRTNKAGLFSGGEQQMLAIGRAMMSRPSVLMLDEPSMGLSPIMTQKIFSTIKELQAEGTTILLVEQNALSALALSDRGYVIDLGRTTLSGSGQELLADPRVQEAYLGEGVGS